MRKTERRLTLFSLALGLVGLSLVCLARGFDLAVLAAGAALSGAILGVHAFLRWQCPSADEFLLPIVSLLTGLGLVIIFRLSPEQGRAQFLWVALGLLGLAATVRWVPDVERLQEYPYLFGVAAGLLVLLPLVPGIGREIHGARLWVALGPLQFQPAELAKLGLVSFLASYLARRGRLLLASTGNLWGLPVPGMRYLGPLLLMWILALGLLILEKDLGTALLFFGLFMAMTYAASGRVAYVVLGLLLFVGGARVCYSHFHHVQVRIQTWLNPWSDIDRTGYQITQSLFALEAGGLFGRGLGFGRAGTIPEVTTDFPFAALVEELGLLGGAAIILLYSFLFFRAGVVAVEAPTPFIALLAAGLGSIIALQSFIIIGGVVKLIPLTGITLPFISYGGSSTFTNFLLVGLLLRASERRAT
jgi:cell division protein FtsW (lipid II flippase)